MARTGRPIIDIEGQIFGKLTVRGERVSVGHTVKWRCVCVCGKEVWVSGSRLRAGTIKNCGCYRESQRVNLEGQRFGLWNVVGPVAVRLEGAYWPCRCECGSAREVLGNSLRSGMSTNCGCVRRAKVGARNHTHGLTNTREYVVWCGMIARCEYPKHKGFRYYGARGIRVCDRWRNSFEAFLEDMGEPPTARHVIDRYPDNDGNYEPGNCRWATVKQNANNTRRTRWVEYGGIRLSVTQWAERIGMNAYTLRNRIFSLGWSVERAITTPVLSRSDAGRLAGSRRPFIH